MDPKELRNLVQRQSTSLGRPSTLLAGDAKNDIDSSPRFQQSTREAGAGSLTGKARKTVQIDLKQTVGADAPATAGGAASSRRATSRRIQARHTIELPATKFNLLGTEIQKASSALNLLGSRILQKSNSDWQGDIPQPPKMQQRESLNSQASSVLVQKMHEEEQKLEQLSWFKKNIVFISQVRTFRETVQAWVTELCREEGKKDYDRMAHLISDYEQVENKGIIGWALGRVQSISPTINQAEKKLKGVSEAVQYKYKRMMNFVLEKNNFKSSDFFDTEHQLRDELDEEAQCVGAAFNINQVNQKLEGVKEIILDKMIESLQRMFESFVREHTHDRNPLFGNKLIFYCVLKTEGDIMMELNDFDKAIKAYKALRNYCRVWGLLEQEMWMAEQLGTCYRHLRYHELATDYFKFSLSLAWELGDQAAEMRAYDNLAIEYFYIGNINKAKIYHDRVFRGRVEQDNSTAKNASEALNRYNRHYKQVKYKFDQVGIKGVKAVNKGKRADFGENTHVKFVPKEESMRKVEDSAKQRDTVDRLKFEKELAIDAEQDGYFDDRGDIMAYKDMTGMTEQEKNFELNKRAARRNFFLGSKIDQEKVKESYKPA